MWLTIRCNNSKVRSDTAPALCLQQNQRRTEGIPDGVYRYLPIWMEGEINGQWLINQLCFLTVYDHPHILGETVDDFKSLRCGRSSLILGESI
jgi:hypothetical protein